MARFQAPAISHAIGERLVDRGFLVREEETSRIDVILLGGAFRYTVAFWQHVGALTAATDGSGGKVEARTPEAQAEVRRRFAEVWEAAGAPEGWARMEASAALEVLLVNGPAPLLSEAGQS